MDCLKSAYNLNYLFELAEKVTRHKIVYISYNSTNSKKDRYEDIKEKIKFYCQNMNSLYNRTKDEIQNLFSDYIKEDKYKKEDIKAILDYYSNLKMDETEKMIVGLYTTALINKSTINRYTFECNSLDFFLYNLDEGKEVTILRNKGNFVGKRQKGKVVIKINEGNFLGEENLGLIKVGINRGNFAGRDQYGALEIDENEGEGTGRDQHGILIIKTNKGEGVAAYQYYSATVEIETNRGKVGPISLGNACVWENSGELETHSGLLIVYTNKGIISAMEGRAFVVNDYTKDKCGNLIGPKIAMYHRYNRVELKKEDIIIGETRVNAAESGLRIIDLKRRQMADLYKVKIDDKMVKIMKYLENKEELNENERFLLDKLYQRNKIKIKEDWTSDIIL